MANATKAAVWRRDIVWPCVRGFVNEHERKQADGYVSDAAPGLAVVRYPDEWQVMHADSGYRVLYCVTKAHAQSLALKLASIADWTKPKDYFMALSKRTKVSRAIHETLTAALR